MDKTNFDDEDFKKNEIKKDKLKKIISTIIVILIILLGITAYFLAPKEKAISKSSNTKIEILQSSLSIDNFLFDNYTASTKGTAKNVSSRNFSYVKLEYSIYDAEGNNLGTAWDSISNLQAGDKWVFKATLLNIETELATYKLVDINYW